MTHRTRGLEDGEPPTFASPSIGELVSVVIPTFQRAYTLGTTIDSVLAQSHQTFEIVIVDDGSTDGTDELVMSRYGHDRRVRYTWQPNHGVTGARNKALELVKGNYVAFLDSDDCWEPWKLELQLACLRFLPKAGMIWTNMAAVSHDGQMLDVRYLRRMYGAYRLWSSASLFTDSWPLADVLPTLANVLGEARLFYGDIYPQIIMGNLVHTSTSLLRREHQKRVGGFDPDLEPAGEDHDFHLRTAREGPVCFADVSSVHYRVGRDDALSHPSQSTYMALNNLKTIDKALSFDPDHPRLTRSMVQAAYANAHAWAGSSLLESGDRRRARQHLVRSLWLRPLQVDAAARLVVTVLPIKLGNLFRRAVVGLRHAARWLNKRLNVQG